MSPKKLTRAAVYIGVLSLIGLPIMGLWRPNIGFLVWWPVAGLLLSLGLIGWALFRGWMLTVKERVAMSDAINLCYMGEKEREDGRTDLLSEISYR